MRIPTDVSLATYIRQLIAADKVELFYLTDEWKNLRLDVLEDHHYECQECLKRGRYTRAICVHHCNEVRVRPDLALSRYYTDREGKKQKNLIPLCNTCHNQAHNRFDKWRKENCKATFTNEERW